MDTRAVIDRDECVNVGDWDGWLALFDDNVVIDEQLAGHLDGNRNLEGAGDGIQRGDSTFLMHPQHIVVDGDQGTVIWRCDAANRSGVPIDAFGCNYFQVTDGRTVCARNIPGTTAFEPLTSQDLG